MLYEKKLYLLRTMPQPIWLVVVETDNGRVVTAIDSSRKTVYADPIDVITYLYTKGYTFEHGTWFYLLFQVSGRKYRPVLTKLWDFPFQSDRSSLMGYF